MRDYRCRRGGIKLLRLGALGCDDNLIQRVLRQDILRLSPPPGGYNSVHAGKNRGNDRCLQQLLFQSFSSFLALYTISARYLFTYRPAWTRCCRIHAGMTAICLILEPICVRQAIVPRKRPVFVLNDRILSIEYVIDAERERLIGRYFIAHRELSLDAVGDFVIRFS